HWTGRGRPPRQGHSRAPTVQRAAGRPRRSGLVLAVLQLVGTSTAAGVSRVASVPYACMLSLLPRRNHWVLTSLASPAVAAFPAARPGRLPHCGFRGLLSVQSLRPASSRGH